MEKLTLNGQEFLPQKTVYSYTIINKKKMFKFKMFINS